MEKGDEGETPTKNFSCWKRLALDRRFISAIILISNAAVLSNSTILSIALPRMEEELDTTDDLIAWVTLAPMLLSSCLAPIFGKVADDFGRKKLWLIGTAVVFTGFVISGLSNSFALLLVGRILVGCGIAIEGPSGFGLMTELFPPEERMKPVALVISVLGLSPSLGILWGGVALRFATWRWLFWIPLPVLLATFVIGLTGFTDSAKIDSGPFDWIGSSLFAILISCLLFAVNQAPHFGILSWQIITAFVAFCLLIPLFWFSQTKAPNPLIPTGLFRDRIVLAAFLSRFLLMFCFMFGYLSFPFLFSDIFHYSQILSAAILFVRPTLFGLCAMASGFTSRLKISNLQGKIQVLGALFFLASNILLCFLDSARGLWFFFTVLALQGIFGIAGPANTACILQRMTDRSLSSISGMITLLYSIAGVCGITASMSLLQFFGGSKVIQSYRIVFFVGAGAAFLGVVLTVWLFFELKRQEEAPSKPPTSGGYGLMGTLDQDPTSQDEENQNQIELEEEEKKE